jgi:hypothetical protein
MTTIGRSLSLLVPAFAVAACQVTPNTTETTPPTITVTLMDKLGNQGWTNNQKVVPSNGYINNINPSLDILIAVSGHDPGGMNTLNGGVWFFTNCLSGSYGGTNATLASISETATHNPPNTVTDTLPFLYEATTAGLKAAQSSACTQVGYGAAGLGTIVVDATATNQANLSTTTNDDLQLTGGVLPM